MQNVHVLPNAESKATKTLVQFGIQVTTRRRREAVSKGRPSHCCAIKYQFFSFSCSFSSCSFPSRDLSFLLLNPDHLFEARTLHAHLLVGGFLKVKPSPNGSNSKCNDNGRGRGEKAGKLGAYVKLGILHEALRVFHRLPQRQINTLACNAILRAYVHEGMLSQAIHFFHHSMLRLGLVPDNFTYPIVLKACSMLCSLEEGRRVQALIRVSESCNSGKVKPNVYVKCALIDMLAKCGSLDEARMAFEDMPEKDLASWTTIICGTIHRGKWNQALCLFRRMRLQGLKLDSVITAAVIPACGWLDARQVGTALQGCATRSGFESDLFVSNALIDMYCKWGNTQEACFIFSNMVTKDLVSWSTLIAGYSQNCLYSRSIGLYLHMKKLHLRTNAVISASVLTALGKLKLLKRGKEMHNYILKQEFDRDIVVDSALIDMYANCGSMKDAETMFEITSQKDINVWNSIIAGYAHKENFHSAFRIFRGIWASRFKPNSITLVSIIPVCSRMVALNQGKEIHSYAIKSSLDIVVSVGNSLIDMYCKCGYLELGSKIFNQMIEKNVVTYNTIISAYGTHGQAKRALVLFEEMKGTGIRPNKITFLGLLSACSHAGLVDGGWFLYNSMKNDHGLKPDMEHYACMVDLLGRAGHIGDACEFIKMMPVGPDSDVWGSLLAACRIYNIVELADLLSRPIFSNKLEDSGHHILLSNIYASTQRWEEASKIRAKIKKKGLMKKPGNSWIQVGRCIYTFNARETTHSDSEEIKALLESLLFEMKNQWYEFDPSLWLT